MTSEVCHGRSIYLILVLELPVHENYLYQETVEVWE